MSEGFSEEKIEVAIYKDEIQKLLKKYKKIKKYQRSSIFEVKTCLLSESHISIHTWPEEGKAAVDVYTCGDCNPKIGCDIIIQQLYATNHTLSYIER